MITSLKSIPGLLLLLLLFASSACKSRMPDRAGRYAEMPAAGIAPIAAGESAPQLLPAAATSATENRRLIWTAEQRIEVENITNSVTAVNGITARAGGYVQSSSVDSDSDAHLTIRVPSPRLTVALSACAALGTSISVKVSSTDVTEDFVDVQARAKVAKQLRDRLNDLVARATNVHEVLEVERELARVQADIEGMEARLKSLVSQSEMATLELYLVRRSPPAAGRIYGPLGLVWYGLTWFIEKLFIIR